MQAALIESIGMFPPQMDSKLDESELENQACFAEKPVGHKWSIFTWKTPLLKKKQVYKINIV